MEWCVLPSSEHDACGVEFRAAIPGTSVVDAFGARLRPAHARAPGMLFVHASDRLEAAGIAERELLQTHGRLAGCRVARLLLRFARRLAWFDRITSASTVPMAPLVETDPVAQAV
jgi:hypothetical protein